MPEPLGRSFKTCRLTLNLKQSNLATPPAYRNAQASTLKPCGTVDNLVDALPTLQATTRRRHDDKHRLRVLHVLPKLLHMLLVVEINTDDKVEVTTSNVLSLDQQLQGSSSGNKRTGRTIGP